MREKKQIPIPIFQSMFNFMRDIVFFVPFHITYSSFYEILIHPTHSHTAMPIDLLLDFVESYLLRFWSIDLKKKTHLFLMNIKTAGLHTHTNNSALWKVYSFEFFVFEGKKFQIWLHQKEKAEWISFIMFNRNQAVFFHKLFL